MPSQGNNDPAPGAGGEGMPTTGPPSLEQIAERVSMLQNFTEKHEDTLVIISNSVTRMEAILTEEQQAWLATAAESVASTRAAFEASRVELDTLVAQLTARFEEIRVEGRSPHRC